MRQRVSGVWYPLDRVCEYTLDSPKNEFFVISLLAGYVRVCVRVCVCACVLACVCVRALHTGSEAGPEATQATGESPMERRRLLANFYLTLGL